MIYRSRVEILTDVLLHQCQIICKSFLSLSFIPSSYLFLKCDAKSPEEVQHRVEFRDLHIFFTIIILFCIFSFLFTCLNINLSIN